MSEAKYYHVSDTGLAEGTTLGRITVVLGADYDRVTAERNNLQNLLNVVDQHNDDLAAVLADIVKSGQAYRECTDKGSPTGKRIAALLRTPATQHHSEDSLDMVAGLRMVADPTLAPDEMRLVQPATRRTDEVQFKGMIETGCGNFAVMIDKANAHYGWTFKRHPDGMWVSGRVATPAEMQAAIAHARFTTLQL